MIRSSETADPSDKDLPMKIAIFDKNIAKGDYNISNEILIEISDSERTTY